MSGEGREAQPPLLAIDIGATNLRCGLVTGSGELVARASVPTPAGPDLASGIAAIAEQVRDGEDAGPAVVGVPGRVDYASGALMWGRGQSPEWRETFTEGRLTDLLGMPVRLANDADLATVGEACFGAGRGYPDLVYLTISSGVGAGAFLGGRLFRGRGKLCEVALTLLMLSPDGSGEPVVLEEVASGHGLEAAARRTGHPASAEAIVERVRSGDPEATRLWAASTRGVAAAVVNLAHLLLPGIVIIGGGVSRAGETLLGPVRDWLERYGPRDLPAHIKVTTAALGDDAGLIGAAAWTHALGEGDDP